ncbi:MAG: ERMES complex subunit [Trizodia sp. TS-e1964]|nr:MAG: ERMES complex subunit [Trizodia sp. TS-e1964]
MAFNFNWSPLTADALFYSRARELLTAALNKSPKPPIIVDDILVSELNLGSVPPELEILEIGDLADDRFRGIFKMGYSGDAFLTLQTRVQANPLNTYLSTKPAFTSPRPLAAASGLTIPLQITLSEIKLSAFIILVFSRQKGLTLVFRNDPLESLKVSSTFDSIPFVRDYLQKEIEGQLRSLLMEEVPAIIHRLSLRLWVPEYRPREGEEEVGEDEEIPNGGNRGDTTRPIDPLASPSQVAVDSLGNSVDPLDFSLESSSSETQSLFSQKNLLRIAALTDSNRTLSLFTPSIRDTVFRAWAGVSERSDAAGANTPITPGLTRSHSYTNSTSTTYTFSDAPEGSYFPSRHSTLNLSTSTTGVGLGAGRYHSRNHAGRKKKTRVLNLRKKKDTSDAESTYSSTTSSTTPSTVPTVPELIKEKAGEEGEEKGEEEEEEGLVTPPRSPATKLRARQSQESIDLDDDNIPPPPPPTKARPTATLPRLSVDTSTQTQTHAEAQQAALPAYPHEKLTYALTAAAAAATTTADAPLDLSARGMLDKAWILKLAAEIARRAADEKGVGRGGGAVWRREEVDALMAPPPAYEAR